jgi:AraC-like DNA-binding protein
MQNDRNWLSRLLEMIPVRGTLDYRCFLGAPWRIDLRAEISYGRSGRPGDTQRALHGAVRNLPPAGKRSHRTAARAVSPRRQSATRARAHRSLQRACPPWTLPELAQRYNMSRATFIRHFQERLDRSAGDLLTDIRMPVAANALKTSDMSDRRRRRACRLPIGGRLPARVQAPHGHHARPVAQRRPGARHCDPGSPSGR